MTTIVTRLAAQVTPIEGERTEVEFAALVGANQRRVVQIAYSVLRDPHDAEEVAQEAFLKSYRRIRSLREPEKFRAWVGRIVFRLALNRRRARMRRLAREAAWRQSRTEPEGGSLMHPAGAMRLGELQTAIDALPEKLRVVLLLCAVEEMSAADVAQVLGVPVGTVRSRLHLARRSLLKRMNP